MASVSVLVRVFAFFSCVCVRALLSLCRSVRLCVRVLYSLSLPLIVFPSSFLQRGFNAVGLGSDRDTGSSHA